MRDPGSPRASLLHREGVEIVRGNLDDRNSLDQACRGVGSIFSIQMPEMDDLLSDSETRQVSNLVAAARRNGVPQFIQSTVSGTASYLDAPGGREGRWRTSHIAHYWEAKAGCEEIVRTAGFAHWTIIRPGFFMENFVRPSFMFANWTDDRLLTAIKPSTYLALVAVDDIGTAVAEAVVHPDRFDRIELELAGDWKSMTEIAGTLSDAMGVPLTAHDLSIEQVLAQGMMPELVVGQEWTNEVPVPARPEIARKLGIRTTDFASWANRTLRDPPT